jgi:hypothetical protein
MHTSRQIEAEAGEAVGRERRGEVTPSCDGAIWCIP